MVFLQGIDQKFLHTWIEVHRIKPDDLQIRSGNKGSGNHKKEFITNATLIRRIKSEYDAFKAANTDLENFFDRSIIEFKRSRANYPFITSIESVSNAPVFICTYGKNIT